ncbi:iron ABC transporter permease [Paenibacillus sp. WQ 127069]|uniref:Iron ABC transporter permease n=1 Tax=Paenibacillus baimaensis TaxID=2982185 RepID=A0ABT2UP36_9BACL|nr:iron ABC transporter permease [Paenibacillus sp. WQ 127069]MCU6795612.1 iron ABC transporter permease [Paenibacillus sp. WQ 127069]
MSFPASNSLHKSVNRHGADRRNSAIITLLIIAVAVSVMINIAIGDVRIHPEQLLRILAGSGDPQLSSIIVSYRLPRVALALLVGASLAVAGVIAQGVMRNPLAAPDTLGLTGGAGLAAVVVTLLLPHSVPSTLTTAAFMGGIIAACAVYALAYRHGIIPVRLALVGVAISAFCSAGIQLLVSKSLPNVNAALIWLSGSLWGRTWDQVLHMLPWVAIVIPLAWLMGLRLDIIRLGDLSAKGLGIHLEGTRVLLLVMAVLLTAAAVAAAGTIGFVGLITPHMARRLVGARHRVLIPVAALLGGLLVLIADALGRGLLPPLEIPAGLIVSVIGGPYFLFLLWRHSRRR